MSQEQKKKPVDSEQSGQGSRSTSVHTIALGAQGELLDVHTHQPTEDFSRLISRCKYGDTAAADDLADQILEAASVSQEYQTFINLAQQEERAIILTSHGIYNVPTASALIVQRLAERMNVSLASQDKPGVIIDSPLPSNIIGEITGADQSLFSYPIIEGLTNYRGCDVIFVDDMLLSQDHEEKISRYLQEECGATSVFFLYGAKLEEKSYLQTNRVLEQIVANREIDGTLESLLPLLKAPQSFTVVQRLLRTVLHPDNKPQLPNYFKLLPDESLLAIYKAASSADFALRFNGLYKSTIGILREELIARGWVSPEGTLYRKQKFLTKVEFSLAAPHQVAVHRLNSKNDISLTDAQLYSRMKYCDPAAVREVANRMAETILKDEQFRSAIQTGQPLYITSSAYGSVPTASTFLTDQIEQQLIATGVQVKRIKIERKGQFAKQDFGSLSAEQRQAAMKARKLELDDDTKKLISGGTVLLVDDLCATGSHEQSIRKVLEEAGISTMFSAYFVKFTEKLMVNEPDTEEWLNRAAAKTPLDFLGWMRDLFTASKPTNQKITEVLTMLTSENRKRWNFAQSKKGGFTLTTQLSVVKGPTGDEITKLRVELLSSNPAEVRDLIRVRANDQIVGDYQLETDKQVGKSKQTKQAFMVDLPPGIVDVSQIRLELLTTPEEEIASVEIEEDVNYRVETLLQQLRGESWAGRNKIELWFGQTKVVAKISKPFILDRDTALAHQYQDASVLNLEGSECQRLQLSITDPEADLLPSQLKVHLLGRTSKTQKYGAGPALRDGKSVYAFPSVTSVVSSSLICFDEETPHRELELILSKEQYDLSNSWFALHDLSQAPKGTTRLKSGSLIKINPSKAQLVEATKKAEIDQCSPKEALELAFESLALNSDDGITSRVKIGNVEVAASIETSIKNWSEEDYFWSDTKVYLNLEIDTSSFDSELLGSTLEIRVPQVYEPRSNTVKDSTPLAHYGGSGSKVKILIDNFDALEVPRRVLRKTQYTLDNIDISIAPSKKSLERQNARKLPSGVFVPQFKKGSEDAARAQRVLDGKATAEDNLQVAMQSVVINRESGFASSCEIGGIQLEAKVTVGDDYRSLIGYDPKTLHLTIKNFDPNILAKSFLTVKQDGEPIFNKYLITPTRDGGEVTVALNKNYLSDLELNIVLPNQVQIVDASAQIDPSKNTEFNDLPNGQQLMVSPETMQTTEEPLLEEEEEANELTAPQAVQKALDEITTHPIHNNSSEITIGNVTVGASIRRKHSGFGDGHNLLFIHINCPDQDHFLNGLRLRARVKGKTSDGWKLRSNGPYDELLVVQNGEIDITIDLGAHNIDKEYEPSPLPTLSTMIKRVFTISNTADDDESGYEQFLRSKRSYDLDLADLDFELINSDTPAEGAIVLPSKTLVTNYPSSTAEGKLLQKVLDGTSTPFDNTKLALQSIQLNNRKEQSSIVEVGNVRITVNSKLQDDEDDVLYSYDYLITIDGVASDPVLEQSKLVVTSKSGRRTENNLIPKAEGGYKVVLRMFRDNLSDLQFDLKQSESHTSKIVTIVSELTSRYRENEHFAIYRSPKFTIRGESIRLQLSGLDQFPTIAQSLLRSEPSLILSDKRTINAVGIGISGNDLALDGYSIVILYQNQTIEGKLQAASDRQSGLLTYLCYLPLEITDIDQVAFELVKK